MSKTRHTKPYAWNEQLPCPYCPRNELDKPASSRHYAKILPVFILYSSSDPLPWRVALKSIVFSKLPDKFPFVLCTRSLWLS